MALEHTLPKVLELAEMRQRDVNAGKNAARAALYAMLADLDEAPTVSDVLWQSAPQHIRRQTLFTWAQTMLASLES